MSKLDRVAIAATVSELLDAYSTARARPETSDDAKAKTGIGRLVAGFLCDVNRIADALERTAADPASDDPALMMLRRLTEAAEKLAAKHGLPL